MTFSRVLLYSAATAFAAILAIYAWNPTGARSWDPRGRLFGVIPYRMPADSMAPTITNGSVITACTGAYLHAKPVVGDIVAFVSPRDGLANVKRIVAVGGDKIEFRGDHILLNGVRQTERFIQAANDSPGMDAITVPQGSIFVAGDNRPHSFDSRYFGPVQTLSIIGKLCQSP